MAGNEGDLLVVYRTMWVYAFGQPVHESRRVLHNFGTERHVRHRKLQKRNEPRNATEVFKELSEIPHDSGAETFPRCEVLDSEGKEYGFVVHD